MSVLGPRFLPTEHAVRTILRQVVIDPTLARDAVARASMEGIDLPAETVDRLHYVFGV